MSGLKPDIGPGGIFQHGVLGREGLALWARGIVDKCIFTIRYACFNVEFAEWKYNLQVFPCCRDSKTSNIPIDFKYSLKASSLSLSIYIYI